MNEFFLHHLWMMKIFHGCHLLTTSGEPLEIIKTGVHNTDSGPDFFNAKIKIGDTVWAGNVEIHLKSSDWNSHHHEKDDAYSNVILHVVFEHDTDVHRNNGTLIPTLELEAIIDERLWENYLDLLKSKKWIPCEQRIREVDDFTINNWLDRLLAERLERKTESVFRSLHQNNNNWEETFYHHLSRSFGSKINAEPFELLARSIPLKIMSRHKKQIVQLEALLFGQAGMLAPGGQDEYMEGLSKEYLFLKNKYKLNPIEVSQWKFLRLRPVNFPTIRIAQFAQLVYRSTHLFSKILECDDLLLMESFFQADVSGYWQSHYIPGRISKKREKKIGKDMVHSVIINTMVPFLFAYGKKSGNEMYRERALQILESIPAEQNSIVAGWERLGVKAGTAYQSQALIQLRNEYCTEKKCLTCSVGNKIIGNLS
ncbi:MAG: DUF2851 family protein [Bacteroidetes bacterium]|nr:DUF2851 family protein [Bacteroidota bacterium]